MRKKKIPLIVLPTFNDILCSLEQVDEFEERVEIWRVKNFPEHDIDDIRVHVQLVKRGE